MNTFSKIRNLDGFSSFLNKLEVKGFNWTGDKNFSYKNATISMSSLISKLDVIYHSECFRDARLTEQDCQKIKVIKNKIDLLNNCEIKTSVLQNCYLKVVNFVSFIFSFGNADHKTTLLSEIETRAKNPDESVLLEKIINTDLSPQVEDALKNSYENYYKKPFEHLHIRKREAMRNVQGEKIHKYNHGLAHTARKVFFIPFVVDYLLRHGLDHLSNQLTQLIKEDGMDKVIQKLQIAMAFEVAGRESECGSRDNLEVYTSYLVKSQQAFRNYCKEKNLVGENKLFKNEQDLERYADAIKNKYYNKFKNENEIDVVTVVMDMTHTLDEFRCYWPSRMKSEIEEINHFYTKDKNNRDLWELAKFCQKAVRATGDRVMTEFSEGFNQRNDKFANSNFNALVFRNFAFSDENTFINCSTNVNYGWDLLKKVAPPVSYSRGETTFSHVLPKTEENPPVKVSSQEALDLISNGKAAIRLINTKKEQWGFEMTMLNDPVFFRPVRQVKGERNKVLDNRTGKDIIDRGFKERLSLNKQIEEVKEPQLNQKKWKPVHHNKHRRLPKLTEYSKKVSLSLLRPDAKVNHFKGEFPKEYGVYRPVGFLYNVDELDKKSEKFVFDHDVGTSSKFWIGKDAYKNIDKKIGRKTDLTLDELQTKLKKEVQNNVVPQSLPFWKMQHASNEMLMCPKKSALKAVFATEDTPQARIQTFLHAVYFSHDYGINVPVLIIDGKTSPKAYTTENLKNDLKILSEQRSTLSKTIYNDLYSCFFSSMERPINKEDMLKNLIEKCNEFLSA